MNRPIIKELISIGDDAVEPLIKAFRFDDRLTRSVSFYRDFTRHRTILPVRQAAYAALQGILKTTHFAPQELNEAGRPVKNLDTLASQLEAYWRQNRLIPMVERWYRTLADDAAGEAAWLEAAGNITQPDNVQVVPDGVALVMTETRPVKPGERVRFRGEPLRKDHVPTVTELMARRIESMLKTPEGQQSDLGNPCRMATMMNGLGPGRCVADAP